jgi:hypothetical protein
VDWGRLAESEEIPRPGRWPQRVLVQELPVLSLPFTRFRADCSLQGNNDRRRPAVILPFLAEPDPAMVGNAAARFWTPSLAVSRKRILG